MSPGGLNSVTCGDGGEDVPPPPAPLDLLGAGVEVADVGAAVAVVLVLGLLLVLQPAARTAIVRSIAALEVVVSRMTPT